MDEKYRDNGARTADRAVTNRLDDRDRDDRDELARRRDQNTQRPPLTPREREERWPIG